MQAALVYCALNPNLTIVADAKSSAARSNFVIPVIVMGGRVVGFSSHSNIEYEQNNESGR